MASKRKYQSLYGGGLITDAAYLVEYLFSRNAIKEGKTLPTKFWNDDRWKKQFQWQIIAANSLLEQLSCVQIMTFLRSRAGKNVLSLGQKKIIMEGAAKMQPVGLNSSQLEVNAEDNFAMPDTDDIVKETNTNLWEKLQ